jgi:DnaJ-class molecular chaperone
MTKTFLAKGADYSDMPLKPNPNTCGWTSMKGDYSVCPSCEGHGGWNLELDAFGPGKHFQAGCLQCSGWGWVKANSPSATCVHDWEEIPTGRMFDNHVRCKKCNHSEHYDSSG